MLQRYHVLLRSPDGAWALVYCRPVGWLLPIVAGDARARAPHVVSRFLEQLNIDGVVTCVTSGIVDRQATGIDWLAVVNVARGARCDALTPHAVADLLESRPILQIQCDLLRRYQQLLDAPHSALSLDWLDNATAWAFPFLSCRGPLEMVSHRADLSEAVLQFMPLERDGFSRACYLKWRRSGSLVDADIAAWVAAAGKAGSPKTIARDRSAGRWLAESVAGVRLASDLSSVNVARAAEAMALAQIDLQVRVRELQSTGVRAESLAELAAEGDRILDGLSSRTERPAIRTARTAIRRACDDLDSLELPVTWIHTDFVPENVFVDERLVSFIDFDEPWIGPPPAAMEFLFSGLRRYVQDPATRSAAVSRALDGFVRAWEVCVAPYTMRRAFASTRLVAEVLRISRRLRSIQAREANGELVGFFEPAARESAARLVVLADGAYRSRPEL